MLVKLSPGVDFIKILRAAFTRVRPKNEKTLTVFFLFWDWLAQKLLVKRW
jgi:hypothetical protein